jgi:hypothetical protein
LLAGLASSLNKDTTDPLLKIYWVGLGDLPIAEVETAIVKAARECQFMPTVKQLRDFAGRGVKPPVPHYLNPVEDELERIETCQFHVAHPPAESAPERVPWCRKCRRLALAANGAGRPQAIGEILQQAGLVPLPGGRR